MQILPKKCDTSNIFQFPISLRLHDGMLIWPFSGRMNPFNWKCPFFLRKIWANIWFPCRPIIDAIWTNSKTFRSSLSIHNTDNAVYSFEYRQCSALGTQRWYKKMKHMNTTITMSQNIINGQSTAVRPACIKQCWKRNRAKY